jgi:hypothetical protein
MNFEETWFALYSKHFLNYVFCNAGLEYSYNNKKLIEKYIKINF